MNTTTVMAGQLTLDDLINGVIVELADREPELRRRPYSQARFAARCDRRAGTPAVPARPRRLERERATWRRRTRDPARTRGTQPAEGRA